MTKEGYINIINEKYTGKTKELFLKQIDNYFECLNNYEMNKHNYEIGDDVFLKKGTLLHGTYKNFEGLKEIVKNGLLSSFVIEARTSKYPLCVGVWNLKKDYYLKDYINFYSGGTMVCFSHDRKDSKMGVIEYDKLHDFIDNINSNGFLTWKMEQTKEARFLPSLVQNIVQIGIIFDGNNQYIDELLKFDILNSNNISDEDVKEFVNEKYYDQFLIDRKNKDPFFTDRESAIIFGVPSNLIEGVLVGRSYEKDENMLEEIKKILPNCYICNLDGKVIRI